MGSSCSVDAATLDRKPLVEEDAVRIHATEVVAPDSPPAPAQRCTLIPSSPAVLDHAIPHHVVSQILRPEVAGFLPADKDRWCATIPDAQCCVTEVKITPSCDTVAVLEYAAQFPLVESVSLRKCHVNQKAIYSIHSDFPKLTHLDLSHGRITAVVLYELPLLTTLRSLRLRNVNDTSVPFACDEPGEYYSIAYPVRGSAIADFELMPSLEVLDLRGCSLDDEALTALTKLRSLKDLRIDIHDWRKQTGLPDFSPLMNLETLSVWVARRQAEVLSHFAGLTTLRTLKLFSCADLAQVIAQFPALESVTISDAWHVDADTIGAISAFPRLHTVILRNCQHVDTEAAAQLLTHLTFRTLDSACSDDGTSDDGA